jgi:hypothetical protein
MIRGVLATSLMLLFISTASAQVIVQGSVLNTDLTSLPGARVQIADSARRAVYNAVADSNGNFLVRMGAPLVATSFHVTAEMIGYQTTRTSLHVQDRQEVDVTLVLGTVAIPLEPLRVTARRRYLRTSRDEYFDRAERVKRMGGGIIIEYEQLQRRVGSMIHTIVLENYAGMRNCPPSYFIDGMRATLDDVRNTPTSTVEGVEIYRSQTLVPVEYQGRSTCGAVLVWTQIGDPAKGSPLTWRRVIMAGVLVVGGFLILR